MRTPPAWNPGGSFHLEIDPRPRPVRPFLWRSPSPESRSATTVAPLKRQNPWRGPAGKSRYSRNWGSLSCGTVGGVSASRKSLGSHKRTRLGCPLSDYGSHWPAQRLHHMFHKMWRNIFGAIVCIMGLEPGTLWKGRCKGGRTNDGKAKLHPGPDGQVV